MNRKIAGRKSLMIVLAGLLLSVIIVSGCAQKTSEFASDISGASEESNGPKLAAIEPTLESRAFHEPKSVFRIIVSLDKQADEKLLSEIREAGMTVTKSYNLTNAVAGSARGNDIQYIAAVPGVTLIEEDKKISMN